jgi:FkbM family methyltransferase
MFKILKLIINHPLNKKNKIRAVLRFFSWQFISRVYKYPILLPFTNKSTYLCWKGLAGLTGNWYFGLMEMEEMSFLIHFLREEDCFFDIGSNVGAYTILASQHSKCLVHSFEPHPVTFKYLKRNINLQESSTNVILHNVAIGDKSGVINFTSDLDAINHVATNVDKNVILVKIDSLYNLSLSTCLPIPTIIKIDVEGFEMNVLKGASALLENPKLKVIIIELNGSGLKYGLEDDLIDQYLQGHFFKPYTYDPFSRTIINLNKYLSHNTIYIRDLNFCKERCINSLSFSLANGVQL